MDIYFTSEHNKSISVPSVQVADADLSVVEFLHFAKLPTAGIASSNILPPVFLEKARSIAAEQVRLSEQLARSYDLQIAKKIGELNTTTVTLGEWEEAQKVSKHLRKCQHRTQ